MPLISKLFCVRRAPLTETPCELRPSAVLSGRSTKVPGESARICRKLRVASGSSDDSARVDDAAQLRAARLDERHRCADDRLFAYGSDFQADVNCRRFCDNHSDRFDLSFLESIRRNAHAVGAGRKQQHGVVAFRVGCDFSLFGGGEAFDGYFRSDDDGAVWVFDSPADAARGLTLAQSEDGAEDKQATGPEQRRGVSGAQPRNSFSRDSSHPVFLGPLKNPTVIYPVRGGMFIDLSTNHDSDAVRRGGTKLEQYHST